MPALQLRFSFLRGWASTWPMHQHTQTAAGDLPDSVRLQSAALYSTSRRPMNSSIGSLLCYVPFHRLNPAETGREDAHFARPLRVVGTRFTASDNWIPRPR